jgi:hypothetical protein
MGAALEKAHAKEAVLLAAMAGRAGASDAAAVRLGERIEEKARAAYDPTATPRHLRDDDGHPTGLLGRLKAHLAA